MTVIPAIKYVFIYLVWYKLISKTTHTQQNHNVFQINVELQYHQAVGGEY